MGYTIKQKIEICLQSEANPQMTQYDLARWVMEKYKIKAPPSQTTICRILRSKNEILGSKESDFLLVRRRKLSNALLRLVLTEWTTQAKWERIPITSPIIQLTANAIWAQLPQKDKDGNGSFSHKWCSYFVKKLNINLTGSPAAIKDNLGLPLNRVWRVNEKVEMKQHVEALIRKYNYTPRDMFSIDEFLLFYCVPLDQIFDASSIEKGLNSPLKTTDYMLTVMLGCNLDGSEKLNPLVVSRYDTFDLSENSNPSLKSHNSAALLSPHALANKLSEVYHINYKFNNNKWITSSIFHDYLLALDHKIESVTPDRRILIFLDESSSHRIINLEFKHIKLVYMENSSKHKNPYNGSFNGMKFDYIPMGFGIIEEFKILYRLQQYLEMINKQRNHADANSRSPVPKSPRLAPNATDGTEILSENDFHTPFIKAIEWIRRSWDSISHEKIFLAWTKTHILNLNGTWPASNPEVRAAASDILQPLIRASAAYDPQKSYDKLKEIMNYLNVVIPWEIDDLIGLVNERVKVSLNYVSIDEMIGSCALNAKEEVAERAQTGLEAAQIIEPQEALTSAALEQNAPNWISNEDSTISTPGYTTPLEIPLLLDVNVLRSAPFATQAPQIKQFQDKLPPLMNTVAEEEKTRLTRGADAYSVNSRRPFSLDALLLATNASNSMGSPSQIMLPRQSNMNPEPLAPISNREGQMQPRKHRLSEVDYDLGPERKRANFVNRNEVKIETPPANSPRLPAFFLVPPVSDDLARTPFSYGMPLRDPGTPMDDELISILNKVISASDNNGIKLSNFAIEELKYNLSNIQNKYTTSRK